MLQIILLGGSPVFLGQWERASYVWYISGDPRGVLRRAVDGVGAQNTAVGPGFILRSPSLLRNKSSFLGLAKHISLSRSYRKTQGDLMEMLLKSQKPEKWLNLVLSGRGAPRAATLRLTLPIFCRTRISYAE